MGLEASDMVILSIFIPTLFTLLGLFTTDTGSVGGRKGKGKKYCANTK